MKWSAGGVVPPGYWSGGWRWPRRCRRAGGTGITSGSVTAAPRTEVGPRTGGRETAAAGRGGERQVVQAGPRLVERVLAPVPMPGEPRANVTNRQPEMVDTPDHAPAHRVLTRAASRRRVLRCTRRLEPAGPLTARSSHQDVARHPARRKANHGRLAAGSDGWPPCRVCSLVPFLSALLAA